MLDALVVGALAGYGIAVPVGAIAVLILETGTRIGLRPALAAGAGAATADGAYAMVAALFGVAVGALVTPLATPLRIVAAIFLAFIAVRGLVSLRRTAAREENRPKPTSALRIYLRFTGLTLLNPMTVAYFAALFLGLPGIGGPAEKGAFVIGAFVASLSWQSILALGGSLLHGRSTEPVRLATSLVGDLIILGFAARIAIEALTGPVVT